MNAFNARAGVLRSAFGVCFWHGHNFRKKVKWRASDQELVMKNGEIALTNVQPQASRAFCQAAWCDGIEQVSRRNDGNVLNGRSTPCRIRRKRRYHAARWHTRLVCR